MVDRYVDLKTGEPIHPAHGTPEVLLDSSFEIETCVLAHRVGCGTEEEIIGVVGVEAYALPWDMSGHANGKFGGKNRACFHQNGFKYMIAGELDIPRDKLFVTESDFEDYKRRTGGQYSLPNNEPKLTQLSTHPVNEAGDTKSPGAPCAELTGILKQAIEAYRKDHKGNNPDSFATLKKFMRDNLTSAPYLIGIEKIGDSSEECITLKNPRSVKGKKRREKRPYTLEYCRKRYSELNQSTD
jgi:hypothetical protein